MWPLLLPGPWGFCHQNRKLGGSCYELGERREGVGMVWVHAPGAVPPPQWLMSGSSQQAGAPLRVWMVWGAPSDGPYWLPWGQHDGSEDPRGFLEAVCAPGVAGAEVVRGQSEVGGWWQEDPWPCMRLLVWVLGGRSELGDIQPQARSWGATCASRAVASLSHGK